MKSFLSNNLKKRLLIMLFLEEEITSAKAPKQKSAVQYSRNFKEASMAAVT